MHFIYIFNYYLLLIICFNFLRNVLSRKKYKYISEFELSTLKKAINMMQCILHHIFIIYIYHIKKFNNHIIFSSNNFSYSIFFYSLKNMLII